MCMLYEHSFLIQPSRCFFSKKRFLFHLNISKGFSAFLFKLTAQADRSYESVAEQPPPEVEFRGERRPTEQNESEDSSFDADLLLSHGSKQIIRLFVPVSVCMLLVVIVSCTVKFYSPSTDPSTYLLTPFKTEDASTSTKIGEGIANALIFVGVIVVATIFLVVLFKLRCTKVSIAQMLNDEITYSFVFFSL